MEKDFDKWPAFGWRFVTAISPAESGVHQCVAFLGIGDYPGRCWKICLNDAFQVHREFRVGDEVCEPISSARLPGDDDPAVDVVEPDLDSPWRA